MDALGPHEDHRRHYGNTLRTTATDIAASSSTVRHRHHAVAVATFTGESFDKGMSFDAAISFDQGGGSAEAINAIDDPGKTTDEK